MKNKLLSALVATALFGGVAQAQVRTADDPFRFDPSKYSQKVTGCDVLASHPMDPHRVAVGLEKSDMDLPAAIAACEAAVERDPTNPRLNYQLARSYGYAGQGEKAGPYRKVALEADYPQAVQVAALLAFSGQNKAPKDKCFSGELFRRSAVVYNRGHLNFVLWALRGEFDGCPVKQDPEEMARLLDAAERQTSQDLQKTFIAMTRELLRARVANANKS